MSDNLLHCICCETPVIARCPTCETMANLPIKVERGLRLTNGQHLKVPFCRPCLEGATPAQFPAILAAVKRRFEALWLLQDTPMPVRTSMREDWATWEAVGWADEIPGLEHAQAARLAQPEHAQEGP